MKTPEEIKKLMDYCYQSNNCSECSYNKKDFPECVRRIYKDATECITHQENRIAELEVRSLNALRDAIYEDAVAHGLWESTDYTVKNVLDEQERKGTPFDNPDEVLRSWAMEPIRKEVNELEMASESEEEYAEELADVIIMSISVAGKIGIDIDAAVRRKMEINKARPWKHGKETECNT